MIDTLLIDQCKNLNVDTNIIQAIMKVESNYNSLVVNVNKIGSFKAKTKDEAKGIIQDYIAKGYSVDIGLMQFNSNNLQYPAFSHYSFDDLLDNCKNIKAGSDIFYLAYESTDKNLNHQERIQQALSIYNTGNKEFGFKNGYVAKYTFLDTNFTPKDINLLNDAKKSDTKISLAMNLYTIEDYKYTRKDNQ